MTEKQLQAAVVECARLFGWRVYHTYDSRRSEPGFPDLTLVRDKRLLFAELKTAKGQLSAAQLEWTQALAETGAEIYVWRPEYWRIGAIEQALR